MSLDTLYHKQKNQMHRTIKEREIHLKKWVGGFIVGFVGGAFFAGLTVYVLMGNYIISTFGNF